MSNSGPVSLNRAAAAPPELIGGGAVPSSRVARPEPGVSGITLGVDLAFRGISLSDGTLPTAVPFAHSTITWVRRYVRNISWQFYRPPIGQPSWTLNHPNGYPAKDGTLLESPIPEGQIWVGRQDRRTFGADRQRYAPETPQLIAALQVARLIGGSRRRRGQPQMRGTNGPNRVTVLQQGSSFGMQTQQLPASPGAPTTAGPYG